MPSDEFTREEARVARRYFSSFADDYHRAFTGHGHNLLHGAINRFFRRRTFQRRTAIVSDLLKTHGVAGKRVLDLGCGTSEVSLIAAQLGARVTGLDVVTEMITIARRESERAGFSDAVDFRVEEILDATLEPADVTLLIGVVEYYRDVDALLVKASGATRDLLIVVDTRGPVWRRILRRVLARLKRFHLYYHPPELIRRILGELGFTAEPAIVGHSFTVMPFKRLSRSGE